MRLILFLMASPLMATWLSTTDVSVVLSGGHPGITAGYQSSLFVSDGFGNTLSDVMANASASGTGQSGQIFVQTSTSRGSFDHPGYANAFASLTFSDWVVVNSGSPGTFVLDIQEACTASNDDGGGFAGPCSGSMSSHSDTKVGFGFQPGVPFLVSYTVLARSEADASAQDWSGFTGYDSVSVSGYVGVVGNTDGVYSDSGVFGRQTPEPSTMDMVAAAVVVILLIKLLKGKQESR